MKKHNLFDNSSHLNTCAELAKLFLSLSILSLDNLQVRPDAVGAGGSILQKICDSGKWQTSSLLFGL